MYKGLSDNQADLLLVLFGGERLARRGGEPEAGYTQYGRVHPATMRALIRKGYLHPSLLDDRWLPTRKAVAWMRR